MMMKKILLILAIALITGGTSSFAQTLKTKKLHPIPSYKFLMKGQEGFKDFGHGGGNIRERRQLNIKTTATTHGILLGDVKVWVVKDSSNVVLGPYYILFGQTLSVPVDWETWGAVVKSNVDIKVDIWFTPF
jgi:hypothetical protein